MENFTIKYLTLVLILIKTINPVLFTNSILIEMIT